MPNPNGQIRYASAATPGYREPSHTRVMAELLLLSGVLALFGLAFWLTTDSDDDNGGGGMMQPVLVPVRVQRRR